MTSASVCQSCGTQLAAGAGFCGSCGKPVSGAPRAGSSLGRTLATVVIVMIAAVLIGALVPMEGAQMVAVVAGALFSVAYIVVAARR